MDNSELPIKLTPLIACLGLKTHADTGNTCKHPSSKKKKKTVLPQYLKIFQLTAVINKATNSFLENVQSVFKIWSKSAVAAETSYQTARGNKRQILHLHIALYFDLISCSKTDFHHRTLILLLFVFFLWVMTPCGLKMLCFTSCS